MKKKKGFKLFAATAMCIFNLFVCFSGVLAWFVAAKQNSASNMQVQMYTHELGMDYKVYKYNETTEQVEDFTHKPKEFDLITYDSILTDRNEHTSIIVEFNITGMSLEEGHSVNLEVECSESKFRERALSNIVCFKFGQINTILDSDSVATRYSKALTYFSGEQETIFEEIDQTDKELTLGYEIDGYSTTSIRVFMLLDYSPTLISGRGFTVNKFINDSLDPFDKDLVSISCAI